MPERTLKESIGEWTDWDVAAYRLGICLGLMPEARAFGAAKHVFWSNHPVGELLHSMLDRLTAQGTLEKRAEPDIQYRWNPVFRGSWEPSVAYADQSVSDLVSAWFDGERTMFHACTEEPEVAWMAILQISEQQLTDEQKALLAAGPLETLLSWHGAAFIDRVEQRAQSNAAFRHLLGGVWRQDMPAEIWNRVEKVRSEVW